MELHQSLNRRVDASNADRGSLAVIRVTTILAFVLASVVLNKITWADFAQGPASFAATLLLAWAGIAMRWWSFRTLGRYFTFTVMTSSDQRVIMTGPYRFVRHPSYLGILLILAGIGISYGNWLSLAAVTLVPLVGFVNRIRVEEDALSAALGQRYRSYAAGHKRLIPGVW